MKKLPINSNAPHLREEIFRRYERAIRLVIKNFPVATTFKSEIFAPSTFSSQLRCAITSVLANHWPCTPPLDLEKLAEIRSKMTVVVRGELVAVISREDVMTAAVTDGTVNAYAFELQEPGVDVLNAIVTLYTAGLLTKPTRVLAVPLNWQPTPPVLLEPQPDNTYLLL